MLGDDSKKRGGDIRTEERDRIRGEEAGQGRTGAGHEHHGFLKVRDQSPHKHQSLSEGGYVPRLTVVTYHLSQLLTWAVMVCSVNLTQAKTSWKEILSQGQSSSGWPRGLSVWRLSPVN